MQIYHELEKLLIEFTNDSENPEINFNLALEYDRLNQTSSAASLYLRCAERTKDKTFQYECLIRAGLCFRRQGERKYSEKSFWQNALYLLPERPEAYMFMSQFFSDHAQFHTALTYIRTGEYLAEKENSLPKFRIPITKDYNGLIEFKFKKLLLTKKCGMTHLTDDSKFLNDMADIVSR